MACDKPTRTCRPFRSPSLFVRIVQNPGGKSSSWESERAPKTRGIDLYQGVATCIECKKGVRTTASPPTLIIVPLDRVASHIVDNDRCVVTKWGRIHPDGWTRAFPAHKNQCQQRATCGDILSEWRASLERWPRPESWSLASARRPTSDNDGSEECLLFRCVE